MRILIQRVLNASIKVEDLIISEIDSGLLIFVGIENSDSETDIEYLAKKISHLRIFNDNQGKMNLSIQDIKGELLVVSQFTLHAQTKKGNRPSFIQAASPDFALSLFNTFVTQLTIVSGVQVKTGKFGADMKVSLVNDGPVTIWMDSKHPSY